MLQSPGYDDNAVELVRFQSTHAKVPSGLKIHRDIAVGLEKLCAHAAKAGVQLAIVSGYRSYQQQRQIWNEKLAGTRKILDLDGEPISEFASQEAQMEAIIQWSAVPGLSRHHWGTELDIFLQSALTEGHNLQLLAAEFAPRGPCARLETWLDQHVSEHGFSRPYLTRSGTAPGVFSGVAAEPWHISHQATALPLRQKITAALLTSYWREEPFTGARWATEHVAQLMRHFLG